MNRILLCGDTHGNLGHCRTLLREAKTQHADAIVILGDWGYWEHQPEGVAFLDDLDELAAHHDLLVYAIDGNHDKTQLLLGTYGHQRDAEGFVIVRDRIRYAERGHRWTWAGTRFIALGGAYSVDKQLRLDAEARARAKIAKANQYRRPGTKKPADTSGTLWFPEEEMTDEDLARILATDSTPVDVLLCHDKPRAAHPDWNRKDLPGCWPNQDRIQLAALALRPRVIVHGHLHWRYTDHIRVDGDQWATVEGLGADPTAREPGRDYKAADSWLLMELPVRGSRREGDIDE
jgi:predicted phosphodiesterase